MIEVDGQDVTFFVSGSTPVAKLGSAIAHGVYADKNIRLRAIGPGPISQAQKAVAVAIGFAAPRGYRLATIPSFEEVTMPDRTVTALVFQIVVLK
jgi:stage V sporulation protein S